MKAGMQFMLGVLNNQYPMKKILAILLTFFSLYTALQSYMGLYRYSNAFLFPESQHSIAETNIVSWFIISVHFLQMLSFFIISGEPFSEPV